MVCGGPYLGGVSGFNLFSCEGVEAIIRAMTFFTGLSQVCPAASAEPAIFSTESDQSKCLGLDRGFAAQDYSQRDVFSNQVKTSP